MENTSNTDAQGSCIRQRQYDRGVGLPEATAHVRHFNAIVHRVRNGSFIHRRASSIISTMIAFIIIKPIVVPWGQ